MLNSIFPFKIIFYFPHILLILDFGIEGSFGPFETINSIVTYEPTSVGHWDCGSDSLVIKSFDLIPHRSVPLLNFSCSTNFVFVNSNVSYQVKLFNNTSQNITIYFKETTFIANFII